MATVLIDLDGVLADSLPNWLETYNLFTGENVAPEDVTSYRFEGAVKEPDTLFRCLEKGLVFLNAGLMDGAYEGFKYLWDSGEDIYLVTYNHESCPSGFSQKVAWVRKHFPWFPTDRIVFTKHKFLVRGDVLIEDNPANVTLWLDQNPEGRAFLVSHPYNQEYFNRRCVRVKSVEGVVL